jgi:hypothetical protein
MAPEDWRTFRRPVSISEPSLPTTLDSAEDYADDELNSQSSSDWDSQARPYNPCCEACCHAKTFIIIAYLLFLAGLIICILFLVYPKEYFSLIFIE